MKGLVSIIILFCGIFWGWGQADVAVVYNTEHPASLKIARHYMEKRAVPEKNLLSVTLPPGGGIERADYNVLIEKTILKQLTEKKLLSLDSPEPEVTNQSLPSSEIRYLVLCRGIPFVISDKRNQEDLKKQATASVDSELASVLIRHRFKDNLPPLEGLEGQLLNPAVAGQVLPAEVGPQKGILMVARLDGPSDEIANQLVDKAIQAEEEGLWGEGLFDVRGISDRSGNTNYLRGDLWLRRAAFCWQAQGFDFTFDEKPETLRGDFPAHTLAFYAGWYDWNANGPFANGMAEFVPGAFAYHLHSFSAKDLHSTTHYWVGPLLQQGATCTVGYVNEPFLEYTLNVGVFMEWFLKGASFGEAAYHALPSVSWQATVVGDPLYRPFGLSPLERFERTKEKYPYRAGWAIIQSANLNLLKGMPEGDVREYVEEIYKKNVIDFALGKWLIEKDQKAELWAKVQERCKRLWSESHEMTRLQRCWLLFQLGQAQSRLGEYKEANETFQVLYKTFPVLGNEKNFLEQWKTVAQQAKSRKDSRQIKELLERLTQK